MDHEASFWHEPGWTAGGSGLWCKRVGSVERGVYGRCVGWQREGKLSHSKFLGKESLSTLPVVSCAVLHGGIFLCPESKRNV